MTINQMGIDIPIALLRDIAVRMRTMATRKELAAGRVRAFRRIKNELEQEEAIRAKTRLKVSDLVHLPPAQLSATIGRTLRISTPRELMALGGILSALMETAPVLAMCANEGLAPRSQVPGVLSLTAHRYPAESGAE